MGEGGFVVPHITDPGIDSIGRHAVRVTGAKQVDGWSIIIAVKPAVIVGRMEDDGHAVADGGGELIGECGDNRERL